VLDDVTAAQVRELAAGSHRHEAEVRRLILQTAVRPQVVGVNETLDLAEALAWATNAAQARARRTERFVSALLPPGGCKSP
jgi:hypothetical protein